ncbi:MAG TPA: cupin domain-containing protein [Novosphingobium sp.]|nr:cupin domain-containing protein [Novosphingobium sp.]
MSSESFQAVQWEKLPKQNMRGGITRRFVNSEKMMVGQIWFRKGDSVPAHRHDNEQFTYVISGALRFLFGEDQQEEVIVGPEEIVLIPAGLLHSALALEDVFELDIFCPPRSDWLDGSDAYMRE